MTEYGDVGDILGLAGLERLGPGKRYIRAKPDTIGIMLTASTPVNLLL